MYHVHDRDMDTRPSKLSVFGCAIAMLPLIVGICLLPAWFLAWSWKEVQLFRNPIYYYSEVIECVQHPTMMIKPDRFGPGMQMPSYGISYKLPDGRLSHHSIPGPVAIGTKVTLMTSPDYNEYVFLAAYEVKNPSWLRRAWAIKLGFAVSAVIILAGGLGVLFQIGLIVPTLLGHATALWKPTGIGRMKRIAQRMVGLEHLIFHILLTTAWTMVLWIVYRQLELTPLTASLKQGYLILLLPCLAWIPVSRVAHEIAEFARKQEKFGDFIAALKAGIFIALASIAVHKVCSDEKSDWLSPPAISNQLWEVVKELFGL